MYIAIRRYEVDPADAPEITRHVDEGFVPLIKQARGFRSYFWIDAGGGTMASISVFEDEEGAQESVRLAAEYVRQHLAPKMPRSPQVTAGEALIATQGAGPAAAIRG